MTALILRLAGHRPRLRPVSGAASVALRVPPAPLGIEDLVSDMRILFIANLCPTKPWGGGLQRSRESRHLEATFTGGRAGFEAV